MGTSDHAACASTPRARSQASSGSPSLRIATLSSSSSAYPCSPTGMAAAQLPPRVRAVSSGSITAQQGGSMCVTANSTKSLAGGTGSIPRCPNSPCRSSRLPSCLSTHTPSTSPGATRRRSSRKCLWRPSTSAWSRPSFLASPWPSGSDPSGGRRTSATEMLLASGTATGGPKGCSSDTAGEGSTPPSARCTSTCSTPTPTGTSPDASSGAMQGLSPMLWAREGDRWMQPSCAVGIAIRRARRGS
mmetsp:Transcript_11157/g.31606  ORF Transcript_11157/g.31606 Transcript_11157/m.31606 type:complete len:245 (+) Transcript_11157:2999-3733(+)